MSLPERRRRRVRPSTLVGVVVAALVVAILVGALTRVGSASDPYWGRVDRSYAAQGRVLVDRSNHSAAQLRQLLGSWAGSSRQLLEVKLDLLVRTTARTARAAAALAPPAPWGGLGDQFSSAMADRARAVGDLRATVDGLLGMSPVPPATAGGTTPATALDATAVTARHGATVSAAQATSAMAGVGALLERADHAYAAVRRAFARAPGNAHLPASRWVLDRATWSGGPVQTLVGQLTAAPQLAAVHQVVLVPSAVSVTPAPLPAAAKSTAPGASLLPPTHSIEVTAVVADYGNVAERDLVVRASVEPADGSGNAVQRRSAPVALQPGASTAVQLHALAVRPGRTYRLTVSVTPPPDEAPGLPTSQTFTVTVAPSASPPPTTTTTTAPPHAKSKGSKGSAPPKG